MRDVTNAILISTAYNPLFSGTLFPHFGAMTFRNIHGETCMAKTQPVVTLAGFSALYPATLYCCDFDPTGP